MQELLDSKPLSQLKGADFAPLAPVQTSNRRKPLDADPFDPLPPPPLPPSMVLARHQLRDLLTRGPVKGLTGMTRLFSVVCGSHTLHVHQDSGLHSGGVRLWTKCPRHGVGNHQPCFKWRQLDQLPSVQYGVAWLGAWAVRALDDSAPCGGLISKSGHKVFSPADADVAAAVESVVEI